MAEHRQTAGRTDGGERLVLESRVLSDHENEETTSHETPCVSERKHLKADRMPWAR
jgi:hypothetical protein